MYLLYKHTTSTRVLDTIVISMSLCFDDITSRGHSFDSFTSMPKVLLRLRRHCMVPHMHLEDLLITGLSLDTHDAYAREKYKKQHHPHALIYKEFVPWWCHWGHSFDSFMPISNTSWGWGGAAWFHTSSQSIYWSPACLLTCIMHKCMRWNTWFPYRISGIRIIALMASCLPTSTKVLLRLMRCCVIPHMQQVDLLITSLPFDVHWICLRSKLIPLQAYLVYHLSTWFCGIQGYHFWVWWFCALLKAHQTVLWCISRCLEGQLPLKH